MSSGIERNIVNSAEFQQLNEFSFQDSSSSRIVTDNTDSKGFYDGIIARRKYVVINKPISDCEWHAERWTNVYLMDKCKDANVRVEWRVSNEDRFGKGQEKCMRFSEFIDLIDNKDETVYLTTQELSYNLDGQPSIISPPLTCLRDDFPLVPSLCKNLIVSNINMWFGSSTRPTTSGLHHDFHDNLYILLRGEKKFTLYSPADALNMYTVGEIVKVHSNGRINYKGQLTRADGADVHADAAREAATRMEQAANRLAQVESFSKGEGNSDEQQAAEDAIDEAMEALLDAERGSCDGDEDDNEDEEDNETWDADEGDYVDSDCSDNDISGNEDGCDSDDENKNIKHAICSGNDTATTTRNKDIDKLSSFLGIKRKAVDSVDDLNKCKGSTATASTPSNFSQVDTKLSDAELSVKFPLFLEARSRSTTVTLTAGQMLYLPAGWFHEVESRGDGASGGHLAFNYWFHPPDTADYERPYSSDFWKQDFEARLKSGNI